MSQIGSGERLHIRLFIEKVEVPVIAATVSCGMNSPAAAQIEIVPTDQALLLLPRTMVHVFYLAYQEGQYGAIDYETGKTTRSRGDELYKLLFAGEVFDIIYTKTGNGTRSVILNCMDFSNLWDTTYLYQLRFLPKSDDPTVRTIYSGSQANLHGAPELLDDTGVNGPALFVAREAARRPHATSPSIAEAENVLGGLLSVLEFIGGVHGRTVGIYDWATVQERRVRVTDQIGTDSGRTAAALYDQAVLEDWLTDRLGGSGEVVSFRQIIALINSYIYYEVAPCPVGVYIEGSRAVPTYTTAAASGTVEPDPDIILARDEIIARMLARGWDGASKPQIDYNKRMVRTAAHTAALSARGVGVAPGRTSTHELGMAVDFGLIAGKGLIGMGFESIVSPGETRADTPPSVDALAGGKVDPALRAPALARQGLHLLAHTIIKEDNPADGEELKRLMEAEVAGAAASVETYLEFWKELGEVVKEVEADTGIPLRWGGEFPQHDKALKLWKAPGNDPVHVDLADAAARSSAAPAVVASTSSGPRQRLITQVFRPDVWFVAPPACNVIFPEEATSFTFRRQMMREVTRLELNTFNTLYESGILKQTYFAPVLENTESLTVGGIGSAVKRLIYPHEIFSGIIPKTEQMNETAFYARLRETLDGGGATATGAPASSSGTGVMPAAYSSEPANRIERFASRAAAFHFLSYRYAARSMSVSGRFLPRLICGFPGVVIDRPSSPSDARPTHFLGLLVSLQHSISQAGGFTYVSYSHARSHRTGLSEMDDLFSRALYGDRGTTFAIQGAGQVDTEIDIEQLIATDPEMFEKLERGVFSSPAAAVILFVARRTTGFPADEIPTRFGDEDIPDSMLGPNGKIVQSIEIRGGPPRDGTALAARGIRFTRLLVTERDPEILPLEEALRPPWFSDEYSNANIGKDIYRRLFGTDSILDRTKTTSVEAAVDDIERSYSAISKRGPVPNYIWFRTYRAGASLPDVLARGPSDDRPAAFHFYAGGNFKGLEGLDLVDVKNDSGADVDLTSILSGEVREIDPEIDPRAYRWRAAHSYLADLLGRRAFRG